MKIKLWVIALVIIASFTGKHAKADEGMWIPMLIGKNYDQMKKQGFKLTPEDLYNVNKASLKDAIVSFGGFCTGELVSKNGLVFTNHHCGYDAAASNSTPENNILDNGFYAKTFQEEKPIPGLFVDFLVRMEDVTSKVMAGIQGVDEAERAAKIQEIGKQLADEGVKGTHYEGFVRDFYKGNQYFLYIFQKFTDIRLVGIPPQSIGKYGGDTDNWEWPRHTGDFSVFRIYGDKDGKPAEYAPENKPITPKKFLPVSIKGVKNNDFAMVYGFPGRTDRFLTSYGVKLATDEVNPTIVKLRDIRLKAWKEVMDKNLSFRLKISAQYASIANYWKYFIGQTTQLKKLKIYNQKQKQEAEFTTKIAAQPEFASLMEDYKKVYAAYEPYAIHRTYINEGLLAATFVRNILTLNNGLKALQAKKDDAKSVQAIREDLQELLKQYGETYNEIADKKIFIGILTAFYSDVAKAQHPKFITEILQKYMSANPQAAFEKYADYLWKNSNLINPEKVKSFMAANPSLEMMSKDPAYQYAIQINPIDYVKANLGTVISDFESAKAKLDHLYLKSLLKLNKNELMYPDANSTMRISYGNVQDYAPKDGIEYKIGTTLEGVMEKYIPKDSEFDLPQSWLDAYAQKSFGQYAENGTIPVNFITNNDITGGNSGSPVINGDGELIGLAFDGNWEAMSGDIAFDKKFKRTIAVDIRYVLWCIDVLGDAKNIIAELDIRKGAPKRLGKDRQIMKSERAGR
ncbi:MAG: S46 family peptidase [Sphingobacteriaceae bacterium]